MAPSENRPASRRLVRLVVLGACLILVTYVASVIGVRLLEGQATEAGEGPTPASASKAAVKAKAPPSNVNELKPARDTFWSPNPLAGTESRPSSAGYPAFNTAGPTPALKSTSRFDTPTPAQAPLRPIPDPTFGHPPMEGLPPGMAHSSSNGSLVDLVGLANSQVEALKEQSIARFQHERLEQLYKAAAVSNEELEIARIKLAAAERRLALLKGIAERGQKAAQLEVETLQNRIKAWETSGAASPAQIQDQKIQLAQAEARLETLKEILGTQALAPGKGEQKAADMKAETPPSLNQKSGDANAATDKNGPQESVRRFLDAIRTGDDRKAEAMFTATASRNVKEKKMLVGPPGSDTARFEVGQVKHLGPDNAEVKAKWTDVDRGGREVSEDMMWLLHKEPEGWRIKGSLTTVISGQPPILLDFEHMEESLDRVEKARNANRP